MTIPNVAAENARRRSRVKPAPLESDDEPRYRPIEWPLVRRLLSALAPYKKTYALAISVGLCHVTLDLLSPRFVSWIINFGTDFTTGKLALALPAAEQRLLLIIGLWTLTFIGSVFLQRLTIILMTRAGENVQFSYRRKIFDRLQVLSMNYYDKTKLGRIISRCTSDVDSLREVNVWGIWQVVANATIMTVAAAMMLATDARLFLSVAWLAIPLFWCNRIYLRKSAAMYQIAREGWTRVSTNLAENITGVRVVTAFNRQDANLDVFNELQEMNTSNNVAVSRVNGVYQPLLEVIKFIGRVVILLYGGYLAATDLSGGGQRVGAVVAVFLYWDWFMNPIIAFGAFYNQMLMAMAGAERVFNLLDTQPEVTDVPGAIALPRIAGHVKFENVTFGYSPERPVLHDVNFEARPGQLIALAGATGGGKTTIVSLIARFYQPQQGRVLVDGQDIRRITGESLHRQTGLVLQTNYLFTGTVMENIRDARPHATDAQVIDSARNIGAHEAIAALKDGYQTEVGERGGNMSLGQRQLICFTRAFLADPRIFMLDEATSAVDTATELQLQLCLEKLLAGRTTFVVAHRLSTIKRADCILVIDAGRIIERGTHTELLALHGKYANLHHQFTKDNA